MKVRALSFADCGAVIIISTLTGCGKSSSDKAANEKDDSYQKIELVMAVNGTDIQIDARVADKFAELDEEETDGNVTIAVYPNDHFCGGNSTKGIEMIAGGGVDLAAYATCVMAVIDEQMSVATIPWIFEDYFVDARERPSTGLAESITQSAWKRKALHIWAPSTTASVRSRIASGK